MIWIDLVWEFSTQSTFWSAIVSIVILIMYAAWFDIYNVYHIEIAGIFTPEKKCKQVSPF